MSNKRIPKPPGDYIIEQIEAFHPLAKFLGFFSRKLRMQFEEIERQINHVQQMRENSNLFAIRYSSLGWVNYDRLSIEIVATVLEMPIDEGESKLTEYHLDLNSLRFLGNRFSTSHFEPWRTLYERAVERAGAEDYLSAIPLVLIIIDGICTTLTGKHPFSGGADAPVFDSQTSGPGGLPDGLALLGSIRRKLDVSPISVPFRHGIVHGLNPNYGGPMVAAKAFNLLQATVDYFDRRRDETQRIAKAAEDQKPFDLSELGRSLRRNAATRAAIESWRARPVVSGVVLASWQGAASLPSGSPEALAAEYLAMLVTKNYGALAKATVDYPKRSISYRAGRLRQDLKDITVTRWVVTGVEDTAPATSSVMARLEGRLNDRTWSAEQAMRLIFTDSDYNPLVRSQPGGAWTVMPDFLGGLRLLAIRSGRSDNKLVTQS